MHGIDRLDPTPNYDADRPFDAEKQHAEAPPLS
jgi:hypothetical protein